MLLLNPLGLVSFLKSKKKIGGNHAFFKDNSRTIFVKSFKIKAMYGVLSQIEAQLSLKNAWLPPIFFLDTNNTYQDLLSLHNFKQRKNIPVLVSITDRKSDYLQMRRTYAQ